VASRLMNRDGYSADGAVEIMRYATTAICPEMQTVVRRTDDDHKRTIPEKVTLANCLSSPSPVA
jgi:hypothetical protein